MIEYYNAGIARYTSMKVGGTAKRICFPQDTGELKELVSSIRDSGGKYVVLGNASNVIFPDGEYDGTVIFTKNCNNISADKNFVTAEC
ncbi:MAG: UDP-N-acetylmuramate dehydrogenase, partial [Clostridia bacterium]|nr:UDP-N-acetylmuramate dehydrogenase [Clostridia bacterium]